MVSTILSRAIGGVVIGYLSDLFGVPVMLRFVGAAAFVSAVIFITVYNAIERTEKLKSAKAAT